MNRCHEIRKQLDHYLDANSQDDRLDIIRRHLDECPDCRGYWEELQALEKILHEASVAPSISSHAHRRIINALRRESIPYESFPRRRTWFGVRVEWIAATAILVGVFGVFHLAMRLTESSSVPKHSPTPKAIVQQNLPLSFSASALVDLLRPPRVVVAGRKDLSWLAQVMISQPQSAARAFCVQPISADHSPVPTPDS